MNRYNLACVAALFVSSLCRRHLFEIACTNYDHTFNSKGGSIEVSQYGTYSYCDASYSMLP